jgi:hypothetical protein
MGFPTSSSSAYLASTCRIAALFDLPFAIAPRCVLKLPLEVFETRIGVPVEPALSFYLRCLVAANVTHSQLRR